MDRRHWPHSGHPNREKGDSIPMATLRKYRSDEVISAGGENWSDTSLAPVRSAQLGHGHNDEVQKQARLSTSLPNDVSQNEGDVLFVIDETKWGDVSPEPVTSPIQGNSGMSDLSPGSPEPDTSSSSMEDNMFFTINEARGKDTHPSSENGIGNSNIGENLIKLPKPPQIASKRRASNEPLFPIDETKWGDMHLSSVQPSNRDGRRRYIQHRRSLPIQQNIPQIDHGVILTSESTSLGDIPSPPRKSPSHNRRYKYKKRAKSLTLPEEDASESESESLLIMEERENASSPTSHAWSPGHHKKHHNYGRAHHASSLQEDGSLSSYTFSASVNRSVKDFRRQESSGHSRFDGDNVLLFRTPKKSVTSTRRKMLSVWWHGCVSHLCFCICKIIRCRWHCRDQHGVHCLQKLKLKVLERLLVVQGLLCLMALILSGMVFLPLANMTADFDGECVLYSSIGLRWISKNQTVSIDMSRTKYGSQTECSYCTFVSVVVAITSLFFIWFFIHSQKVSGLEHSEVKLQLPLLLFHVILLGCIIVSSFKITIGFNYWCHNIILNNYFPDGRSRMKCGDFEKLTWSTSNRSTFYTYSVMAEIATWLLTLTLFFQCCVTSFRIYLNFKAAYEAIEIPHARLDEEESICSDTELADRRSLDCSLDIDTKSQTPMPTYKVEYKKHQIMAKVVFHQDDNFIQRMDPGAAIVVDAEKLKSWHQKQMGHVGDTREKKKVDLPFVVEMAGRRKRRNWTGSLEWPGAIGKFGGELQKHWITRSFEWHGFGVDSLFYSPSLENLPARSYEWPSPGSEYDSQQNLVSHEWHGFDSDFGQFGQMDLFPNHEWHGFENKTVSRPSLVSLSKPKLDRLISHGGKIDYEVFARPGYQRFSSVVAKESSDKVHIRDLKWSSIDAGRELSERRAFQRFGSLPTGESTENVSLHKFTSPVSDPDISMEEPANNQELSSLDKETIRQRSLDHRPPRILRLSSTSLPSDESRIFSRHKQQRFDTISGAHSVDGLPKCRTDSQTSVDYQTGQENINWTSPEQPKRVSDSEVRSPKTKLLHHLERLDSGVEVSSYNRNTEGSSHPAWQGFESDLKRSSLENIPASKFVWPGSGSESSLSPSDGHGKLSFDNNFCTLVTDIQIPDTCKRADDKSSTQLNHESFSPRPPQSPSSMSPPERHEKLGSDNKHHTPVTVIHMPDTSSRTGDKSSTQLSHQSSSPQSPRSPSSMSPPERHGKLGFGNNVYTPVTVVHLPDTSKRAGDKSSSQLSHQSSCPQSPQSPSNVTVTSQSLEHLPTTKVGRPIDEDHISKKRNRRVTFSDQDLLASVSDADFDSQNVTLPTVRWASAEACINRHTDGAEKVSGLHSDISSKSLGHLPVSAFVESNPAWGFGRQEKNTGIQGSEFGYDKSDKSPAVTSQHLSAAACHRLPKEKARHSRQVENQPGSKSLEILPVYGLAGQASEAAADLGNEMHSRSVDTLPGVKFSQPSTGSGPDRISEQLTSDNDGLQSDLKIRRKGTLSRGHARWQRFDDSDRDAGLMVEWPQLEVETDQSDGQNPWSVEHWPAAEGDHNGLRPDTDDVNQRSTGDYVHQMSESEMEVRKGTDFERKESVDKEELQKDPLDDILS